MAGINPATGKSRSRLILFVECGRPDRSAQFLDLTFLESVASEACGNLATQPTAWSRVVSGVPKNVVHQLLQTATMLLCAALKSLYHSIFDPSDDQFGHSTPLQAACATGRIGASASKRRPARRQNNGRKRRSAAISVPSLSRNVQRPRSSASTDTSAAIPG